MDILTILIVLVLIGALLYLLDRVPIDETIKTIIRVVAIVAVVIWLLRAFVPGLM